MENIPQIPTTKPQAKTNYSLTIKILLIGLLVIILLIPSFMIQFMI